MRELILQAAKKNTECGSSNFADLHLLKLGSIKDLDSVKDKLCDDAKESVKDKENRKYISQDIKDGITFAFWFNEDNELEYSR